MSGISKAYQDAYNEIQDMVEEAVKADGQERVYVRYSAYEWDGNDIPINNLNEVPVKGKVKFLDDGQNENDFESEVMDSPTWLEIAVVANKMIQGTENYYEPYLDNIEILDDGNEEVTEITIIMGEMA